MSTKTEKRPWRSGFCGIGNPPGSHSHCRMFTPGGVSCCCDCHQVPETDPIVWEGDNG